MLALSDEKELDGNSGQKQEEATEKNTPRNVGRSDRQPSEAKKARK
jgi:hypothetical protein